MYLEPAVQRDQLFSSAGYIVNKTRWSHEANTINMLVCACESGYYPSTFEWENACAIHCF